VGTRLLLQHHRWRQESVTIKISDTQTIKKRKFSAGKTIALSVGLIPVGLLIILLIYPPVFRITF
jgi:hypothetical protein